MLVESNPFLLLAKFEDVLLNDMQQSLLNLESCVRQRPRLLHLLDVEEFLTFSLKR